jgi:hypothetical protein
MAGAETIISLGVIVVMQRAGQGPRREPHPALTPTTGRAMARATQAYPSENLPAMTRRTPLAAPLAIILPEPIPPPFPPTCMPCPVRGMPFQYGAIITSPAQKPKH